MYFKGGKVKEHLLYQATGASLSWTQRSTFRGNRNPYPFLYRSHQLTARNHTLLQSGLTRKYFDADVSNKASRHDSNVLTWSQLI
jgi:hypothetical protein